MKRPLSLLFLTLVLLIGAASFVLPTQSAFAAPAVDPIKLQNYLDLGVKGETSDDSLRTLIINDIPNFLLAMIGVLCLGYFLLNALKYLFSAGTTESTGEAKNGMLAAVLGLVVALTAFGVITLVGKLIDDQASTTTPPSGPVQKEPPVDTPPAGP